MRDKDILFGLAGIKFNREVINAAKSLKLVSVMNMTATFVDHKACS